MEIIYNSPKKGAKQEKGAPVFGTSTEGRQVTDLKPALRNENRVNVFLDGKYEFSLDTMQVVELKIKVGRVLTEEEVQKYREESEFGKLYQRALEWALLRPRAEKETREYLLRCKKKRESENRARERNRERPKEERERFSLKTKKMPEFSDAVLERVFLRLAQRGYVDNLKFAEHYVENRFIKKGVSRRRLEQELRGKGVEEETIRRVFQESGRDETEEMRKIIARKRRKYNDEKLVSYLVRQGFLYQEARVAVQEFPEKGL